MKLIVMRHGEAAQGSPDADRRLTPKGGQDVAAVCRELRRRGPVPTDLVSSPLVRARETASIAGEVLGVSSIDIWDELQPEADPADVVVQLATCAAGLPMLVSHQPLVGNLVEYFTGQRVAIGTATITVIQLEKLEPRCGELECSLRG